MKQNNRYILIFLSCLLLSTLSVLYFIGGSSYTNNEISQLSVIFLTITIQTLFIIKIRRRYQSFHLFLFHPLFYINVSEIIFFFAPFVFFLFNQESFEKSYIFENAFSSLVMYCLSLLSFNIVCYFLEPIILLKQKALTPATFDINIKKREFQAWAVIYIIIWLIRFGSLYTGSYWHSFATLEIIERRASFSNITSLMALFTTTVAPIFWFIFSMAYFARYKTNKKFKFIFKVLVLAEMIFYFPSGSKYAMLVPFMGYFLAAFFLNQKVRKQFVVFSIILILSLPIYAMFRLTNIMGTGTFEEMRFNNIAAQNGYLYASFYALFDRADAFSAYFIFVEKVQEFWHGKTYLPHLYAPIPRLIWPQKPIATDVNELGREYGLIGAADMTTSPGIGKWAEAYLNFGFVGLFGLGVFLSLFLLLVFKYLLFNKSGSSGFVVHKFSHLSCLQQRKTRLLTGDILCFLYRKHGVV